MSNKQFISNLSATYADVRKLDVKKINLKGKNILEYIEDATPTIKHAKDTRETVTENDLWGQYIETSGDGTLIIHDDWVTNPNIDNNSAWNSNIVKVEDNKAYTGEIDYYGNLTNLALYANIQTENIKNGEDMFRYCSNLTTFTSDLSSLTNGYQMFSSCSNLKPFNSDLSSLTNGGEMFSSCSNLTTFTSDLSSLTDGNMMFDHCTNLTTFTSDLDSLTDGYCMFHQCSNLTTFTSDLSSLTYGYCMFQYCENLTTFTSDLSSLTDGRYMFYNCSDLTTFTSDLSSLTNGYQMFDHCTNLTTFTADLSSLTNGSEMFRNCKLDSQSVMNIIHFIPDRTGSGNSSTDVICIGIGIPNTEEAKQAFAEECYCVSWQELNDEFTTKNWTVEWQFNGPSTMSLRGANTSVYAKLEEVIMPSEEELTNTENQKRNIGSRNYEYTSKDGSKFYNILWYHDSNTENEEYELFDSIGHAIEAFGVVPKE